MTRRRVYYDVYEETIRVVAAVDHFRLILARKPAKAAITVISQLRAKFFDTVRKRRTDGSIVHTRV